MSTVDPFAAVDGKQCGCPDPDDPERTCHREPFHSPHAVDNADGRHLWLDSYQGQSLPRTWSIPDEPGPEVTAVRDRRGFRWERIPDWPGWSAKAITDANGCYPEDRTDEWGDVLAWHGPLTDASAEVQP